MKIRVNIQEVELKNILPNPWNPNKQSDFIFEKERRSIREHGFIDPILVRERAGKFEIIDGEHRFRAAKIEGFEKIPVNNLGNVSDAAAKQLTIIMNETRGVADNELLSKLLKDLEGEIGRDELFLALPMQSSIIEDLLANSKVDWSQIGPNLSQAPPAPPMPTSETNVTPESSLQDAPQAPSRVLGEETRHEYLKVEKDVYQSFNGQIKRINKQLSKQGTIPEDELETAGNSLAIQVISQHFAEMTDAALKKLLKVSPK